MNTDSLPDFVVIGAARSGTTAIHSYLRQCPDIFLPSVKEPNFFAYEGMNLDVTGPGAEFINNSVTDLAAYNALFADAGPNAIKGEASPLYLYEPNAPENMARHVPNAKIVVILRNPIEQAFSHYLYARKLAIEVEPDFTKALMKEADRLSRGWQPLFGYSQFPRYGSQLKRWMKHFDPEQFFIRTYDDFTADPKTVMQDMVRFVGVTTPFVPDMSKKLNAGGVPKSTAFQDFLMRPNAVTGAIGMVVPQKTRLAIRDWLAGFNVRKEIEMTENAREILRERLAAEIMDTGRLLQRDLRHWLD
jgi:hypothetical protein